MAGADKAFSRAWPHVGSRECGGSSSLSPTGSPPSPRSLSCTCALGAYLESRSLVPRLSPQTGGVLHHQWFWRQWPLATPPTPHDWSLERRPLGSLDMPAPMDTPDGAHAFLCTSQSPQVSDQIMDLKTHREQFMGRLWSRKLSSPLWS